MRVLIAILTAGAVSLSAPASAQEIDWQQIDAALGRKPAVSGDVHRYGFPRTDLSVTLDGVAIKPALALGGWVAFKPPHGGAMIMGDLVLLETEINPVMAKLIEGGLQITAVHNHLLRANPATFYMHVGGRRSRQDGGRYSRGTVPQQNAAVLGRHLRISILRNSTRRSEPKANLTAVFINLACRVETL